MDETYDEEYPSLEGSLNDFSYATSPSKNSFVEQKEIVFHQNEVNGIVTKSVKLNTNEIAKNYTYLFQAIKDKFNKLDAKLQVPVLNKSTSEFEIIVTCQSDKLNAVMKVIKQETTSKTKEIFKLEGKYIDFLSKPSSHKNPLREIFSEYRNLKYSFHDEYIQFIASPYDMEEIITIFNEFINKINVPELIQIDFVQAKYFQLIRGAFDCNLKKITSCCKKHVNVNFQVSPNYSEPDLITISGEEEDVKFSYDEIIKLHENCKRLSEVKLPLDKNLHTNLTRACGLEKIFKETKVSVFIPKDSEFKNEVVLIGESSNIIDAIVVVGNRSKNYSLVEVDCPSWIRDEIVKIPSFSMSNIKENYPRIWPSYNEIKGSFLLDGPVEQVKTLSHQITETIEKIKQSVFSSEIRISREFLHSYTHDSGSKYLKLIENSTMCKIIIDQKDPLTPKVVITGETDHNVKEAHSFFIETMHKLQVEDEYSLKFNINYLSYIMDEFNGAKGISDKFKKLFYGDVKVNILKSQATKAASINVKGSSGILEHVKCYLEELVEKLKTNIVIKEIQILKPYQHLLIGKGGSILNEIKRESGIEKILIPQMEETGPSSNYVTLVGSPEAVVQAENCCFNKTKIEMDLDQVEITLPKSICEQLRLANGLVHKKLVNRIYEELQKTDPSLVKNANIIIPQNITAEKVVVKIHGNKKFIMLVKSHLEQIVKEKLLYVDVISVNEQFIKDIIGIKGKKLKEFITNLPVEIILPQMLPIKTDMEKPHVVDSNDKHLKSSEVVLMKQIYIMGKSQADTNKVKSQMVKFIQEIEDSIEADITIPKKYLVRFFRTKDDKENLITQLLNKYPRTRLINPSEDRNKEELKLKGPSKFVKALKTEILNYVYDWSKMVVEEVTLKKEHLFYIRNKECNLLAELCQQHNVNLRVKLFEEPDKGPNGENVETKELVLSKDPKVILEGLPVNIENVKKIVKEYEPSKITVDIPQTFHKIIIGKSGIGIKNLQVNKYVQFTFPKQDETSDSILISGPKNSLEAVRIKLNEVLQQLITNREEWEKKNCEVEIIIARKWVANLIGKEGKNINILKKQFNIFINVTMNKEETNDLTTIILKGEKPQVELAKQKITAIIYEWENTISFEITNIDKSIHGRIRGFKSINIKNIEKKFKVKIRFAQADDHDNKTITVSGLKDGVKGAVDAIQEIADKFRNDGADEDDGEIIEDMSSRWKQFSFTNVKKVDTSKKSPKITHENNIPNKNEESNPSIKSVQEKLSEVPVVIVDEIIED